MGAVLYNFDGKNMRQGGSSMGTVVFNIDGNVPLPLCALFATGSI